MEDNHRTPAKDEHSDDDRVEEDMFGAYDLTEIEDADSNVEFVPADQAAAELADMIPPPPPAVKPARKNPGNSTHSDGGEGPDDPSVPSPSGREPWLRAGRFFTQRNRQGRHEHPQGSGAPDAAPRSAGAVSPKTGHRTRIGRGLIIAVIGLAFMALIAMQGANLQRMMQDALAVNGWQEPRPLETGVPSFNRVLSVDESPAAPMAAEWDDPISPVDQPEPEPGLHKVWHVEFTPSSIGSGVGMPLSDDAFEASRRDFAVLMGEAAPRVHEAPDAEGFRGADPDGFPPESAIMAGHEENGVAATAFPAALIALTRTVDELVRDMGRVRELLEMIAVPPQKDGGDAGLAGEVPHAADVMEAVGAPYDGTGGDPMETATDAGAFAVTPGANPVLLTNDHAMIGVGDAVRGYGRVVEIHQAAAGRILIFE